MTSFKSGSEQKKSSKSFYRKLVTAIQQLNFNTRFQKLKLTSLTRQFSKLVIILHANLTTKPTDKQSYLHSKSEHPRSVKNSIAYSQALHLNKICCNKIDLEKNCQKLLKTLT